MRPRRAQDPKWQLLLTAVRTGQLNSALNERNDVASFPSLLMSSKLPRAAEGIERVREEGESCLECGSNKSGSLTQLKEAGGCCYCMITFWYVIPLLCLLKKV